MSKLIPALRGHHLVGLHFFQGKGYDDRFVENLHAVLTSLQQRGALVVTGADDVCRACPHLARDLCRDEREIGEMDEGAISLLGVTKGNRYDWKFMEEEVIKIFPLWHKKYCGECTFMGACKGSETFRDLAASVR